MFATNTILVLLATFIIEGSMKSKDIKIYRQLIFSLVQTFSLHGDNYMVTMLISCMSYT